MIAIIAEGESADTGAVHYAFEHAGFAPQRVSSPDRAEALVNDEGCANCVLAIDASLLVERGAEGRSWASFLADHPALGAVVTSSGTASDAARRAASEPNRIVLENPFDAAAVVAGVRHATATPMARVAPRPREGMVHERAGGR